MSDKVVDEIAERARLDQGWGDDRVDVSTIDIADSGTACVLYAASHATMPMAHPPAFAVLADGDILSASDSDAAVRILAACGDNASAGFWAEAVSRFLPGTVPPGVVLHESRQAPVAVKRAEAAGQVFAPPAFVSNDPKRVRFWLMDFESSQLYLVDAGPSSDGHIDATIVGLP